MCVLTGGGAVCVPTGGGVVHVLSDGGAVQGTVSGGVTWIIMLLLCIADHSLPFALQLLA